MVEVKETHAGSSPAYIANFIRLTAKNKINDEYHIIVANVYGLRVSKVNNK